MKKRLLAILALLAVAIFAFTSCNINPGHKEHTDANKDHTCDECFEKISECSDENKDHKCDTCGATLTQCADENKDHICDTCGAVVGAHEATSGSHTCDWCGQVATKCVDGNKDHKCDVCGETLTQCADENKDHKCDVCGETVTQCADENKDHKCDVCGETLTQCADGNKDHKCDVCGETLTQCADENKDHKCDWCGETVTPCADENKDHKCDVCGADVSTHAAASGKHTCDWCGETVTQCSDESGDYYCDVCGAELELPENLERVSYYLNISDLVAGSLDADLINGKFTIVSGSEIRNRTKTFDGVEYNKSVKIGNSTTKIKVSVPGNGTLSFLVQNGSSGASTQFITVTAPDGTVHNIEFVGTNEGSPVVQITLAVTEGVWTISRGQNGGTQDIFKLDLSCVVEKSDENGFEIVSTGKVDYLLGDDLDTSNLQLNATFANGKTDSLPLADVTVDSSAFNKNAAGTYTITISYKNYEKLTYTVNIYAPDSIKLGFDAIEQIGNSSAGNGVYFNHSFKEVYGVGDALDTAGLSVTVTAKLPDGTAKDFLLNSSDYTITGFDSNAAGKQTLTISYDSVSNTVDVFVVATAPSKVNDVYQVKVDKTYTGAIGAVVDKYNMFTTIQQALDYLAGCEDISAADKKLIVIGEGTFTEKLEITIPNLTIIGAGVDKTVIEWDSIYGLKDAGGFVHTTDSTATVAIRESATNVTIENLTISNYWNSQARMDAHGLEIERALALLVQADRFIMKNGALLGIQDTLELFTGRQYFENVFISGYTDFIFGTNNTTYFKNCTIHVIDTSKDDSGTAGYLTAFKGSNKGANDAIVYGAIFDGCKFTADDGVTAGKTAIGRTWGAYAAVAVINSELGEHISVDGYDSANNKNKRYISMNGIHPTDSTVQFVEYNNTGAGAITEAVAGMRFLTADEAALYVDFATIFGTTNGKISYLDPWDPSSTETVVDDRTYYYFNGNNSPTGTSNTFDTTTTIAKGGTLDWAGLHISAENGNVAWNQNANSLNMKAGAFITFDVPAGTIVIVETYPNYNYFTLNGVATASANMLSQYYAEATTVTLMSTGDLYLYSIIINPGEEAPKAPTLTEIKASGMGLNYTVGAELSYEGLVLKAYYSDNSIVILGEGDYTVDATAVNNAAAGEYDVVFSYEGKTVTITVTYEDPNADPEITKNTLLDFSTPDALEAVKNNPKVTISGSVRHNGGEIQIQGTISFPVKAGTIVIVHPYANTSYASFTIGKDGEEELETLHETATFIADEDCTVVYTGLSNNYLVSIDIICPIADGTYVFGGKAMEGDVTGILASTNNITISGTCKTHSGGAQLGADSEISFIAPAFATVTIQGFDTNYGKLNVLVGDQLIEMDANAQYVFSTTEPVLVVITAVNAGTEEAPDYSKSYITYLNIATQKAIDESVTINFGSAGNYKEVEGLDISGIQIGDNGGNNSQIKNGSMSFLVKAGATVTVNGYPKYTSYTFGDGATTTEEITAETYSYTATRDTLITITPVSGNNYFYSIDIKYSVIIEENTTINFGSAGNYTTVEGLEISSDANIRDNGGNNSQFSKGTMSFVIKAGATVTVNGYPGYTSYTLGDGTTTTEEITAETYTYTATKDVTVTITPVSGNNYFYSIDIKYPVVAEKENVNVTFGSNGNWETAVDAVDLSTVKVGNNGGNNAQVKEGYITITLSAGAKLTINGYSGYTDYTLTDGTNTVVVNKDSADHTAYVYTTDVDVTVTITPNSGNNYFYSIVIEY